MMENSQKFQANLEEIDACAEEARLEALQRLRILDTSPEESFDNLTRLAAFICGAPMALICFVDRNRLWFKSCLGIETREMPRLSDSFCIHAIRQNDLMVVPDSRADKRFAESPLVIMEPYIRFYAGVPLLTPEGYVVGTLCVFDRIPKELSEDQREALRILAHEVMSELELRRNMQAFVHAQEKVIESHRLYQELIHSLDGMLWEASPEDFSTSFVSPQCERITGYSQEQFMEGLNIISIIHPDDRQYFVSSARKAIQEKKNHTLEFRVIGADGRVVWLRAAATVVVENNQAVKVRGIAMDITCRKQVELQLFQSQKMDAIGRLAGGVAHDFNNLLTAVIGYAELTKSELPEDSKTRADIQEILKAAHSAAELTGQLLAFSRRQIIQPDIVNLNGLIGNIGNMLRRLIGEDIEIVLRLAPDLSPVKVDRAQMEQVLMNLAVNARDAMPMGGTLLIKTRNTVMEKEGNISHYVMLSMKDNGTGMEKKTLEHIFEPFFTTKEQGKGTGLGLATVYGIVQQNQGHIEVTSEINKGTTFSIYLPRTKETGGEDRLRNVAGALPKGSETVLVVEDEPLVRRLAAQVLNRQGYHVMEASNGEEALLILGEKRDQKIHLLITDVVMPKMGGRELAGQFKRIQPHADVLFTSGYTNDEVVRHGVLDSEINFLQKPYAPGVLVRKVREILDRESFFCQPSSPE